MSTDTFSEHRWKFFHSGGLDQVILSTAADLRNLAQLDQKLWVALSCPVKGLQLDEKTLALIDTDQDGHIRVPELLEAVNWAYARLRDPEALLDGEDGLKIGGINGATPEGQVLQASAQHILRSLGRANDGALTTADAADTAAIFAASALNGSGVIPPESTEDPNTQALIQDIITCTGGTASRAGKQGITAEQVETFFNDLTAYSNWSEQSGAKDIAVLGDGTADACNAVRAVRVKVEDYFARCRMVAFDERAIAALNRSEDEYLAIATKDLKLSAEEVAAFPLARVETTQQLPLLEGVNPAWREALATLHRAAVTPVFGADKASLNAEEWLALNAKLAPYETWLGSKAGSTVEQLGLRRAKEILAGEDRAALTALVERDQALEPEFTAITDVERLVRYHRDMRNLLRNFVNFSDFYSPDRDAIFQDGVLYLDGRACELCIQVDNPAAHAKLAVMSRAYIAYVTCTRPAGAKMQVAACVTQGDSDYLFVGRHGVFYDRKGRDWDAVITKIIDNPISVRQAFWSPYKKAIRFLEEQVAKRAAAADSKATGKMQAVGTAATTDSKTATPAKSKFDVGTVAALGVGVGAIGTLLGGFVAGFMGLGIWMPLGILVIMLLISCPSMLIAWLKLRQRTLGPILDANGWAINGRVKISVRFGTTLTAAGKLPKGAQRFTRDPCASPRHPVRNTLIVLLILLVTAGVAIRIDHHYRGHYFWGKAPVETPSTQRTPTPSPTRASIGAVPNKSATTVPAKSTAVASQKAPAAAPSK